MFYFIDYCLSSMGNAGSSRDLFHFSDALKTAELHINTVHFVVCFWYDVRYL